MGNVRAFDLLKQDYVQTFTFQPSREGLAASAARRGSYYADDPHVVAQLKFLVSALAEHLGFTPLDPRLATFPF